MECTWMRLVANSKLIQQCLFMTSLDENEFADALLLARPSIRFIDMLEQSDTNRPKYRRPVSYTHLTLPTNREV